MAVLKLEIDPELLAKVEKVARMKNITTEAAAIQKLREYSEAELKRKKAFDEFADFIERLEDRERTRYMTWSNEAGRKDCP